MNFERTLQAKCSIKKQKSYTFDFTKDDIAKGKAATYENPHFCRRDKGLCWFALYANNKGKLTATMLHSYDKFEEITK